MRNIKCILLTILVALIAACGSSGMEVADGGDESTTDTTETVDATHTPDDEDPDAHAATIAVAKAPEIEVYADPDASDVQTTVVGEPDYPLTFAVSGRSEDMVRVQLPIRPNGSTGWVRTADVELSITRYRIEIDLGDHTLVLRERGEVVMEETVAVGTAENPTPTGEFYIYELLQPEDPNGVYGPFAFGLSGHSDQVTEFAGGDGRIGIHGTNQPELLGTEASHGCARMSNDAIARLADLIPLGTPVDIHA